MQINAKDWLVMLIGKKAFIARATDENTAQLKDKYREKPAFIDITSRNVLANLGKSITPHKTVFGASTNAYKTSFEVQGCKVIVYAQVIDMDKLKHTVTRALKKLYSLLPNLFPLEIELYNEKGNLRGQAKYEAKSGKSIIRIYSNSWLYEEDVWLHEFGHILLDRASKKVRAAWIDAYDKLLVIDEFDKKLFNECKKDLVDNGPAFFKQLNDEYKLIAKAMFDWIKKYHNISVDSLKVLYEAGKDLSKYLPNTAQFTRFVENDEEVYALKNFNEYFACSFAKYCMKQDIRESELMRKTIVWAKKNIERIKNDKKSRA